MTRRPCAWCGRLTRGRRAGEPTCGAGYGCSVPRPERQAVPFVERIGELTTEERLTVAVTVDGSWWAP